MSAFSTLVTDVIALLNAAPAVAGGRITRASERDVAQSAETALAVRIESSTPERGPMGAITWISTLAIDIYARGNTPDTVADPILALVYARVMADTTLAGTLIDLAPAELSWAYEAAETDLCVLTVRFAAQHRTSETLT